MEIHKLNEYCQGRIRSSFNIPHFYNIAEELIFNAIDASSTSIEVVLDLSAYSITVNDNGVGISPRCLDSEVGRRYYSSKCTDEKTYGCRGEAIASLCCISRLEIQSRVRGSNRTFKKNFADVEKQVEITSDRCPGTTVKCRDIFYNMMVRRKCMKPPYEIAKVRDFIQKMSILHHSIEWTLIDNTQRKVLCKYVPQKSVASRFLSFHSHDILVKMKVSSNLITIFFRFLLILYILNGFSRRRLAYPYTISLFLDCCHLLIHPVVIGPKIINTCMSITDGYGILILFLL